MKHASSTNLRQTPQLKAILLALSRSSNPLSAGDILASVKKKYPSVNKTTVYRTLERLSENDLIESIMIKEGISHYELKDRAHHHHFVCLECESIYCLTKCTGHFGNLVPNGFSLKSHDLTLRGVCKDCQQ